MSESNTPNAPVLFDNINEHMLRVQLNNSAIWMRMGTRKANDKGIKFVRDGYVFSHTFAKNMKRHLTKEAPPLVKAKGTGRLYVADQGMWVTIAKSNKQRTIVVNGRNLLAFPDHMNWDINLLKIQQMIAGGLFNVTVSGKGPIAITSMFAPCRIQITPDKPFVVDPWCIIGWSGNLKPSVKVAMGLRDIIGRNSGEIMQLEFSGHGWVLFQPFETKPTQHKEIDNPRKPLLGV